MKRLSNYIKEQREEKKKHSDWLSCVKKMYEWYCEHYKNFYDEMHFYSDKNHEKCDLIDKETIADCSGFVGACLCLAGYTDDPLLWNVRLGSFNHYKNSNADNLDKSDTGHKEKLLYMADINAFECHRISDEKKDAEDLSEIKAGDILVKGSHVTIAADDGAKHLYDWGKTATHEGNKPVDFYVPKDKNTIFPFRSYWRLK